MTLSEWSRRRVSAGTRRRNIFPLPTLRGFRRGRHGPFRVTGCRGSNRRNRPESDARNVRNRRSWTALVIRIKSTLRRERKRRECTEIGELQLESTSSDTASNLPMQRPHWFDIAWPGSFGPCRFILPFCFAPT